jgi:hypothetical protein
MKVSIKPGPDQPFSWPPREARGAPGAQFGWKLFQITAVTFVDLEHTANAGSPFPNMDGYLSDVAVTEGPAVK